MPPEIAENSLSDIIHLISSLKELKPSKKEEALIDEYVENLKKLKPEQLQQIKEAFIATLDHIIGLTKKANIHSQSESLAHLMHRMSFFTTATTIATILAIWIFLPVIQIVAVSLCAVLCNLLIIFGINIILLTDDSPILSKIKEEIAGSLCRLEELSRGIVRDEENLEQSTSSEQDTSDEGLGLTGDEKEPDNENVLSKSHSQNSIPGSLQGRSTLFPPLKIETANNDNVFPPPAATSTP